MLSTLAKCVQQSLQRYQSGGEQWLAFFRFNTDTFGSHHAPSGSKSQRRIESRSASPSTAETPVKYQEFPIQRSLVFFTKTGTSHLKRNFKYGLGFIIPPPANEIVMTGPLHLNPRVKFWLTDMLHRTLQCGKAGQL